MWNALVLLSSSLCAPPAASPGVADAPFVQEWHQPYPIADVGDANDVRRVVVDGAGNVWAATKAGVYRLKRGETAWSPMMNAADAGPAFDVTVDRDDGRVWAAAWNGLYQSEKGEKGGKGAGRVDAEPPNPAQSPVAESHRRPQEPPESTSSITSMMSISPDSPPDRLTRVEGVEGAVAAVCATEAGVVGLGADRLWRLKDDAWTTEPLKCAHSIRAVMHYGPNDLWIATGQGLYHHTGSGDTLYQTPDDILSSDVRDIAPGPDDTLWAGGLCGITVYRDAKRAGQFTPQDGLPSVNVQCAERGPGGVMWVGTQQGVTRYDGQTWSLRHSRRWLLDDDVRDVAFDTDGTAWVATARGVSTIRRREMTLADKAEAFHAACMARHVRAPYIVERCAIEVPGDLSTWKPEDDDNDGGYTAVYLAMESFRYAASKEPGAQENARKAFSTLEFLQAVTETPGFFARTVVPVSWKSMHDANESVSDAEWADRHVQDPRYKRVDQRWRPSKDGQWLWKGDTSSDEVVAQLFGLLYYYDLAADEADRARVKALVCRIVDYIIDGGYMLKDIDGTHTRWGVWAPEMLNEDPDWAAERGINSLEILSFLKAAYHVSGDDKYQEHAQRLIREHHYGENARLAKTYAPAWATHIDTELLAMTYPALLLYETDSELHALYRDSLDRWYAGCENDMSPFFNFLYASLTGERKHDEDSLAFLRDAPLDLVRWTVDNTRREDVQLVRAPEVEPWQTNRVLPASERGVIRWDESPWPAVQGDGGRSESSGVYWLLPYWMGRHYGFILPPGK